MAFSLAAPGLAQAQEMSIEDAYKAIPHPQTPFDAAQSNVPADEAKFLTHLFFVTDMAMRSRVITLQSFYNGDLDVLTTYNEDIDSLLESFEMVKTPEALAEVQKAVVEGIRTQQRFFNQWAGTFDTPEFNQITNSYQTQPLVQESHDKLFSAYDELKRMYPNESLYNKKAFYDHISALDFI